MPSASRAAGTRPARRTAVSAWASADSRSSASRKAATMTRCWATPVGVLLGQGAQLAVDGPVELLAGHPLGDARLGKPRTLGGQSRPTPVLAVVRTIGWCARASAGRSPVARCRARHRDGHRCDRSHLCRRHERSCPGRPGRPAAAGAHRHRTHRTGDPRLRDDRCSPRARHQLLGLCCRFGRPARRVTVAQCTDGHRRLGRRCNVGQS